MKHCNHYDCSQCCICGDLQPPAPKVYVDQYNSIRLTEGDVWTADNIVRPGYLVQEDTGGN